MRTGRTPLIKEENQMIGQSPNKTFQASPYTLEEEGTQSLLSLNVGQVGSPAKLRKVGLGFKDDTSHMSNSASRRAENA